MCYVISCWEPRGRLPLVAEWTHLQCAQHLGTCELGSCGAPVEDRIAVDGHEMIIGHLLWRQQDICSVVVLAGVPQARVRVQVQQVGRSRVVVHELLVRPSAQHQALVCAQYGGTALLAQLVQDGDVLQTRLAGAGTVLGSARPVEAAGNFVK